MSAVRRPSLRQSTLARGPETVLGLIGAGDQLKCALRGLGFRAPVSHVYNPLDYAWPCYEEYLRRFALGPKRVIFLGMNPGPFGMVQTGIPFGEVNAVRDWLKIKAQIQRPECQHPQRPISGLECKRSEISGQRLWGLFAARFVQAEQFFSEHFVLNYCPLAFMEASGRNRTPDKLSAHEKEILFRACDEHLVRAVNLLDPEWVIGVGDFARRRAETVFPTRNFKIGQILHPSPANPQANRAWAKLVTQQLIKLGVWVED